MRSANLLIWLAMLRGNADQENLEFLAMLKERMQAMLAVAHTLAEARSGRKYSQRSSPVVHRERCMSFLFFARAIPKDGFGGEPEPP